jgi:hypothetical protein
MTEKKIKKEEAAVEEAVDNNERKFGRPKKGLTDEEIARSIVALREKIVTEMNRRKAAGEKWRQLNPFTWAMLSAVQKARKLANDGYSTRVGRE